MKNNLSKCNFKCCGCSLCEEICPKNAIQLKENEEGFLEYSIDEEKCISCGLCIKKCPQVNETYNEDNIEKYYAAYLNSKENIKKSTSGGLFQIIVERFASMEDDVAIIGCAFDENLVARHICIENESFYKLYGSKYVQSDTRGIYSVVKDKLEHGKKVIFSGTPCQVQALYSFLGRDKYKNLYTIDLICHGVPSPLLFKKYIQWIEKKKSGKIEEYKFRNKDKNSWELLCSYTIKGKKYYKNDKLDPYYKSFIKGDTYREACYKCKYANKKRVGDISLGDFWGIEEEHPNFSNNLGVSLVIINSKKGKELFNMIRDDIKYIESDYIKASNKNHNLKHPTIRPKTRDKIYSNIKKESFDYILKYNLRFRISIIDYVKAMIPRKIKRIIKMKRNKGDN